MIADPVVRNRGTLGGSLCQADAAEDLGGVLGAQGEVVIRGSDGERVVGMNEFHIGPYMTAVGSGEILTEVRIAVRPGAGSAHEKVERRAGDWAIAAASAAVWIEGNAIADAGVALAAVGLTTIHLDRAEELLRGKPPSDDVFDQVGDDRLRGLHADARRSRAGGLQAPPRRRSRQARPAARDVSRPAPGGLT